MPEPVRADPHGRPSQRTSTIVAAAIGLPREEDQLPGTPCRVCWRAALRVFELSYGKPAETVELDLDVVDPLHVAEMTSAERALRCRAHARAHPHLAELVPPAPGRGPTRSGGAPPQARVAARDSHPGGVLSGRSLCWDTRAWQWDPCSGRLNMLDLRHLVLREKGLRMFQRAFGRAGRLGVLGVCAAVVTAAATTAASAAGSVNVPCAAGGAGLVAAVNAANAAGGGSIISRRAPRTRWRRRTTST